MFIMLCPLGEKEKYELLPESKWREQMLNVKGQPLIKIV